MGTTSGIPLYRANSFPEESVGHGRVGRGHGTRMHGMRAHARDEERIEASTYATGSNYVYAGAYLNEIANWWPPEKLLNDMAVPEYNTSMDGSTYNVVIPTFWLPGTKSDPDSAGPTDALMVFVNPVKFIGTGTGLGSNDVEIRNSLYSRYHSNDIKVIASAFGATAPEFADSWPEATSTCDKLADFAIQYHFDGVDLDYECSDCFEKGVAEEWLIDCTKAIRKKMPMEEGYLLTHAPQAPYFMGKDKYPGGGYTKVNDEVGHLIDYYNMQFYNQGATTYDTCETLFDTANGWALETSVKELIEKKGVPASKIVIGKPVTKADAYNTGWISAEALRDCIKGAGPDTNGGMMVWQFSSDVEQDFVKEVLEGYPNSIGRPQNRN